MKQIKKVGVFLILALASMAATAQSADEVIKQHLNAIGGLDKLRNIQTQRFTGNFQQGGMDIPIVLLQKRPRKMKVEVTFQGMTQQIAYNDTMGWMINPFQGRSTPERMTADMAKEQRYQADIDGALVDYATKGNKVEYAGEEDIEGSPAIHLKLTTAAGDIHDYYFDKEAYLMVKEKAYIKSEDGTTNETESNFSDYKEVDGILYAHTIEIVTEFQGQKYSSFMKIDKIENNVPLEDALFVMPETK